LARSVEKRKAKSENCLLVTFISSSPAETEGIGRRVAEDLDAGSVLALKGELGSGKTIFTKGLVTGLGGSAIATSPTFTIVHEYQGRRLPIFHFDFFRLENQVSTAGIGLDDYFFGNGVCVIEWADRFPDLVPVCARWIFFEIKSKRQRIITLLDHGDENSCA
jgi:tRNA threonylcarbamoyladenosine biosynthesis protein TsaE